MDDSLKLQLISAYYFKRNARVRNYILNRQKYRSLIITNYLKTIDAHTNTLERALGIFNPPTRSETIYRPIEVGQDLLEKLNGSRFESEFRISKNNFAYICEKLRVDLEPKYNPLSFNHKKATVEEKVAICLFKLKSRSEYAVVGNVFGYSAAAVCKYVNSVVRSITKRLTPLHIKMPNANEARVISEEFKKISGIPQIIGCIDGSHIPVIAPTDGHKDYLNRKGWTSIILQAVVDHKSRFIDICCKFPGSVHDAQVFRASALYRRRNEIFPKSDYVIDGVNIPYLLIGDPAYPSLPWLLKDFPGGGLDSQQSNYNLKLNYARVKVEQCFGMLKKLFRILGAQSEIDVNFMPLVVTTCCTLYNIIYNDVEITDNNTTEQQVSEEEDDDNVDQSTASANLIRNTIAKSL